MTCVALKYRTEDELPQLYDKQLLAVFYEGSMEEVRTRVLGDKSARVANAQNANGETVLMKVCRRALSGNDKGGGLNVVSLLLKSGANPMVCCDSGKNVLHDVSYLQWSSQLRIFWPIAGILDGKATTKRCTGGHGKDGWHPTRGDGQKRAPRAHAF